MGWTGATSLVGCVQQAYTTALGRPLKGYGVSQVPTALHINRNCPVPCMNA